MQFYLNGFFPGDPAVARPEAPWPAPAGGASEVDVLIVGSGPAGLVLAAQLAQFEGITTRVVERRPGRSSLDRLTGSRAARSKPSRRSG